MLCFVPVLRGCVWYVCCYVVSVMLYPCMLCVDLSMCLFVMCVACFTVFVNCLVKQFAMCSCYFVVECYGSVYCVWCSVG